MPNLHFERCCLLFNLASLYSRLGLSEDRTSQDGVKRASAFYQVRPNLGSLRRPLSLILYFVAKNSAGTLSYLRTSAWNKLKASLSDEDGLPLDLSEAFLSALEFLMLAQAQECVWQWAVMGMIMGLVLIRLY
jgi:programmed cell death 6-interacting protein